MKSAQSSTSANSKKILVNPLIAGNGIHYNKGKYTVASSNFGVKESTWSEKVHYNPKFFQNVPKKENVHINPNYLKKDPTPANNAIYVNPNFLAPAPRPAKPYAYDGNFQSTSKYKYVRKEPAAEKCVPSTMEWQEPKCVSKYRLVYSTAPSTIPTASQKSPGIQIKSKYSIRTCQPNSVSNIVNRQPKKRLSKDFKRISRTKLVRKSVLKNRRRSVPKFRNSPRYVYQKRHNKVRKYRYKFVRKSQNRSRASSECGSFKTYSRTKIVRKSILRAQIESRTFARKSPYVLRKSQYHFEASKYKFFRKDLLDKMTPASRRSHVASRIKKRKSLITLTSRLRKNNQPCPFYNRFGRCKGKARGTCNKIHDPLYVAICKKLPFGKCTDKTCLLSHDVRPGKMPTCYHYLAGLCQRDNCPYLHIKVNSKAPVCRSFLQGYCPDVFNCLKRHEYICPIFVEKGSCPKGKCCVHPHKIPTVQSKLLTENQLPLMARKPPPKPEIPLVDGNLESHPYDAETHPPLFILSDDAFSENPPLSDEAQNEKTAPKFTRYFALPLSEACDDNDVKEDDDKPDV
ncbi:ZnF_C3H1 [Nesidiocoris tenuis]|uniref:ZnF_C3H1 n=1 Tax=Nesidiocoris tenuis TaxID=355587 RepID=A0ABN7B348_9HEMI|nr:ZnF_C3H1 [Nesidiocoris tenuis]